MERTFLVFMFGLLMIIAVNLSPNTKTIVEDYESGQYSTLVCELKNDMIIKLTRSDIIYMDEDYVETERNVYRTRDCKWNKTIDRSKNKSYNGRDFY